jgi:hypothetical protein
LPTDDTPDTQFAYLPLVHDKVKLDLTYYLTIYKDLSFGNTWDIAFPFRYAPGATTLGIATGNVNLPTGATAFNPVTTFDVSLSYLLFDTVRLDLGYQNITPELVDHMGERNSVFYSVGGAVFYGNVALYIDPLIDRAMNPPDKSKAQTAGRFHVMN